MECLDSRLRGNDGCRHILPLSAKLAGKALPLAHEVR
jgi:hypothetical protein